MPSVIPFPDRSGEWIKTNEGLPECEEIVATVLSQDILVDATLANRVVICDAICNGEEWRLIDHIHGIPETLAIDQITHWFRLPPIPE